MSSIRQWQKTNLFSEWISKIKAIQGRIGRVPNKWFRQQLRMGQMRTKTEEGQNQPWHLDLKTKLITVGTTEQ